MLCQREPKNERSHEEYRKIGRAQTFNPDKLAPIHKSTMHFSIGKTKASPIFRNDVQITPEIWFTNGKQKEPKRKASRWFLSRNYTKEQAV